MTERAVTDLCHAVELLLRQNEPSHHRVAVGMQAYLEGKFDSVDEALSLRRGPGEQKIATKNALSERDRWVRLAVATHYHGAKPEHAAERLASELRNYHDTGWKRGECNLSGCPPRLKGKIYEFCWAILKAKSHVIGASRVKQILAARDN